MADIFRHRGPAWRASRIALIEAGRERLGLTTKVPGIAFIASTFARQNWNYQTEPVPALNGRRLSWFQGRILGGSSSINGMLYLRGHSLEYDQWAQRGCQGWSFDQVLPYFRKAEMLAAPGSCARPWRAVPPGSVAELSCQKDPMRAAD